MFGLERKHYKNVIIISSINILLYKIVNLSWNYSDVFSPNSSSPCAFQHINTISTFCILTPSSCHFNLKQIEVFFCNVWTLELKNRSPRDHIRPLAFLCVSSDPSDRLVASSCSSSLSYSSGICRFWSGLILYLEMNSLLARAPSFLGHKYFDDKRCSKRSKTINKNKYHHTWLNNSGRNSVSCSVPLRGPWKARFRLYCTSRREGFHQAVQLDVPVSHMLTGIPQPLLHFLEK